MNSVILLMVAMALSLAAFFLGACIWYLGEGQFDDLETPALRILKDDPQPEYSEKRKIL